MQILIHVLSDKSLPNRCVIWSSLEAKRIEINFKSEVVLFHLKSGLNSTENTLFAFVYESRVTGT